MDGSHTDNLERAKAFLRALEDREDIRSFFTEDIVQTEFPNRLVPAGATRGLAALREAQERGKRAVTSERYEVLGAVADGERVALEVLWTATLAVPFGETPAGGTLRAHLGMFMTFRDGRIARQHNYDCYEPF